MKIIIRRLLIVFSLIAITASHALAGSGAWDRTYAPIVSGGAVNAMALQTDGKLVVGGFFTLVNSSQSRFHLARLFSDGSLDTTFFNTGSGVSSTVWSLAVQTDGRIVVGGDFTAINGTSRTRIARLNSNGTVDGSFLPTNTINGSVLAVAVQTNNAVIIGGSFNNQGTFPSWNARLNADGSTDTSFSSFPNGAVNAIAIQSDGKIVIGGAFTTVNGATRNRIARLNADGSLDNTFQNGLTGASSTVRCLQIQTDGKILIGGDFTAVNNTSRNYIARLNSNGSLDAGFASFTTTIAANGPVYAISVQPDNNVIIGGSFSTYSTASLSHIARIYPDGTRDTTFTNFGINGTVQALAIQSDGGILAGGLFTTINNTNWSFLGRFYGNLYPPEFVTQPISRGTNVGANVTFSAQVSNPTTTSFQWRKDGNNISGATGTSYNLFNVQFSDAGNYSVFVSDAIGGTTSSNALLQVGIAPAFTSQAGSSSVTQGQSASFSVTATGTPLNYFWKKNGAFITGQTNASLIFASVVATNAATYTCQVSNFLGSITSTGAVLTVAFPPTISVQPVGQTIGVGSNFTVSVTADGNPAIAYQWRTNGYAIIGATDASYTVTGAQISDAADYDVVLTNSIGSITSSVATVSVIFYPPTISQQPVGGNVLVGSNFTLNVSAAGTAPFYWQWRTNGTPISGANASSFAITSAQLTDAGSYDVVVTNGTGSVTSSVAVVNVGYVPVVMEQPFSLTNIVGSTANFSCAVTGSAPINLQWTFNGNPLTDATNTTLTITNLQSGNIGYYALTATNVFGGTVSSNAALNLAGYDFGIWNGLVSYYPFNGNANDASGNGNNLINNGATYGTDLFGNANSAAVFNAGSATPPQGDGDDNYGGQWMSFGNAKPVDNLSAITVSMWLKPGSFLLSGAFNSAGGWILHQERVVFIGTQGNAPQGFGFTFGDGSNWFDLTGGLQLTNGDFGFNTNGAWVHCVLTGDATGQKLFANGVLVLSDTSAFTQTGTNSYTLGLGAYYNGSIDNLRIYNRALSSNEVAVLYALESQSPFPPPLTLTANVSGGSNFNLNLSGNPGQNYVLQTATNLQPPIQWLPVLTNAADTNGVWQFTDTNLNSPQKFYRVTTP